MGSKFSKEDIEFVKIWKQYLLVDLNYRNAVAYNTAHSKYSKESDIALTQEIVNEKERQLEILNKILGE